MSTPSSFSPSDDCRPHVTNNIGSQTINNTTFNKCDIRCNSVNAARQSTTDDGKDQCDPEMDAKTSEVIKPAIP